jgi:ribosomal protein S7
MLKGKRQKAEKQIYSVFFTIKGFYLMSGVLFLYESIRLLLPPFLLVPIKLSAKIHFIPTMLPAYKKQNIALHEFVKSIKEIKRIGANQKIEAIIIDSLLQLVFDGQNTGLLKKQQQLNLTIQNKTLLHYRW